MLLPPWEEIGPIDPIYTGGAHFKAKTGWGLPGEHHVSDNFAINIYPGSCNSSGSLALGPDKFIIYGQQIWVTVMGSLLNSAQLIYSHTS